MYFNSQHNKTYFNSIFLTGVALIAWQHMSVPGIGILDGNNPLLFLGLLYIGINIVNIKRIHYNCLEILVLIFFSVELLVTILFRSEQTGLSRFFNGYVGYAIVYIATRIFIENCSYLRFEKFIKNLFWGTAIITIVIGVVQLVYIHVLHSPVIYSFLDIITFRDLNYVREGSVQLHTEPSLFGTIVYICFAPAALYLYENKKYSHTTIWIISGIVFLINILGFSVRFLLDTAVFLLLYRIYRNNKNFKSNRRILYTLFGLLVIAIVFFSIFYFDFFSLRYRFNSIKRLYILLHVGVSKSGDLSGQVRFEYIRCAIAGFFQKPLFGWGAGGFSEAMKYNLKSVSVGLANKELVDTVASGTAVSYSFIFTQICECGIVGVCFVALFYAQLFRAAYRNKRSPIWLASMFLAYSFVQNEILGNCVAALCMGVVNSRLILKGENYRNNRIDIVIEKALSKYYKKR